ncbi:MAG TPA: sigma-70 family RNA polymerase sigma factor, partial [Aggregicoccus sp.]|nr:sigma-70 family RNA polymerase sigma factor [Aggregicoccus sp.]
LRHLEGLLRPEAEVAARRVGTSAPSRDELHQALRVRLLVASGAQRPRIATYTGRGPLRAWLGVAALRLALSLCPPKDAPATAGAEDLLVDLVDGEPDPELRHLQTHYRAEFRSALADALAALPERARAVLRLTYVERLRLAQVARLYQVHESSVSRWVSQATAEVGTAVRRRLMERLAVSPATARSVERLALDRLDLSIARLLGEPGSS